MVSVVNPEISIEDDENEELLAFSASDFADEIYRYGERNQFIAEFLKTYPIGLEFSPTRTPAQAAEKAADLLNNLWNDIAVEAPNDEDLQGAYTALLEYLFISFYQDITIFLKTVMPYAAHSIFNIKADDTGTALRKALSNYLFPPEITNVQLESGADTDGVIPEVVYRAVSIQEFDCLLELYANDRIPEHMKPMVNRLIQRSMEYLYDDDE